MAKKPSILGQTGISNYVQAMLGNDYRAIICLALDQIDASPYQPRHEFNSEAITELAESIKEKGIIQPLLVRPKGDRYELVAGERRLRAALEAGLHEVPVIVRDYTDDEAMEIAIIENIQRENLNPVEEGEAYRMLQETRHLTTREIAERVGKSKSHVANYIKITKYENVKEAVRSGLRVDYAAKIIAFPEKLRQKAIDTFFQNPSRITLSYLAVMQSQPTRPKGRGVVSLDPQEILEKLLKPIKGKEERKKFLLALIEKAKKELTEI